jgi:nucleoside-diphosphate kinase
MLKKSLSLLAGALMLASITSCNKFDKTDSGLEYKILKDSVGEGYPEKGGYITFWFEIQNDKDSILDTQFTDQMPVGIPTPDVKHTPSIEEGFRIVAIKLTYLSPEKAGEFYGVHVDKPFYPSLKAIMSESPIIALILEKANAVEDFRKLIGSTNPANADEGTIRKLFAKSLERNAVHGSDSDENAKIEGSFFFSDLEKF